MCIRDRVIRFERQAPGVEREDLDGELVAMDQIGEHHVFGTEAAGKSRRREIVGDGTQQRARGGNAGGKAVEQGRVVELEPRVHAGSWATRRMKSGCVWSAAAW